MVSMVLAECLTVNVDVKYGFLGGRSKSTSFLYAQAEAEKEARIKAAAEALAQENRRKTKKTLWGVALFTENIKNIKENQIKPPKKTKNLCEKQKKTIKPIFGET